MATELGSLSNFEVARTLGVYVVVLTLSLEPRSPWSREGAGAL